MYVENWDELDERELEEMLEKVEKVSLSGEMKRPVGEIEIRPTMDGPQLVYEVVVRLRADNHGKLLPIFRGENYPEDWGELEIPYRVRVERVESLEAGVERAREIIEELREVVKTNLGKLEEKKVFELYI